MADKTSREILEGYEIKRKVEDKGVNESSVYLHSKQKFVFLTTCCRGYVWLFSSRNGSFNKRLVEVECLFCLHRLSLSLLIVCGIANLGMKGNRRHRHFDFYFCFVDSWSVRICFLPPAISFFQIPVSC